MDPILKYYKSIWGEHTHKKLLHLPAPNHQNPVRVFSFEPTRLRKFWVHATLGMHKLESKGIKDPVEIHFLSDSNHEDISSALQSIVEFHILNSATFGQTFELPEKSLKNQTCYDLLLTYPMEEALGFPEIFYQEKEVLYLFLLPITPEEKTFIEEKGIDQFDDIIFEKELDYFNFDRKCLIEK